MVFVAQRGDVRCFAPARDVDPAFGEAFDEARAAGVEILPVAMRVTRRGLEPLRRLPLEDEDCAGA